MKIYLIKLNWIELHKSLIHDATEAVSETHRQRARDIESAYRCFPLRVSMSEVDAHFVHWDWRQLLPSIHHHNQLIDVHIMGFLKTATNPLQSNSLMVTVYCNWDMHWILSPTKHQLLQINVCERAVLKVTIENTEHLS